MQTGNLCIKPALAEINTGSPVPQQKELEELLSKIEYGLVNLATVTATLTRLGHRVKDTSVVEPVSDDSVKPYEGDLVSSLYVKGDKLRWLVADLESVAEKLGTII